MLPTAQFNDHYSSVNEILIELCQSQHQLLIEGLRSAAVCLPALIRLIKSTCENLMKIHSWTDSDLHVLLWLRLPKYRIDIIARSFQLPQLRPPPPPPFIIQSGRWASVEAASLQNKPPEAHLWLSHSVLRRRGASSDTWSALHTSVLRQSWVSLRIFCRLSGWTAAGSQLKYLPVMGKVYRDI